MEEEETVFMNQVSYLSLCLGQFVTIWANIPQGLLIWDVRSLSPTLFASPTCVLLLTLSVWLHRVGSVHFSGSRRSHSENGGKGPSHLLPRPQPPLVFSVLPGEVLHDRGRFRYEGLQWLKHTKSRAYTSSKTHTLLNYFHAAGMWRYQAKWQQN